jgi:hypothetical protein
LGSYQEKVKIKTDRKTKRFPGMPRRGIPDPAMRTAVARIILRRPGRKLSSNGVRRTTETLTKNWASLLVSGDHVGFQKRSATCSLKEVSRGVETRRMGFSRILGSEGKIGGKLEGSVGTDRRHEDLRIGCGILLQDSHF